MHKLVANIPEPDNRVAGLAPPGNTNFDIEALGLEPLCLKREI